MLFEEAETTAEEDPERYAAARDHLMNLIRDGKAVDVLETYYFCKQSCDYVYGILRHVAYEVDSGISDEIVNFAQNLLDDWSK